MSSCVLFGDQFVLLVDNPLRLGNMPKGLLELSLHAAYVRIRIVGRLKMRPTGLVSQGDVCPRRLEITLQAERSRPIAKQIHEARIVRGARLAGTHRVLGKTSELRRHRPIETVPGTQVPKISRNVAARGRKSAPKGSDGRGKLIERRQVTGNVSRALSQPTAQPRNPAVASRRSSEDCPRAR
jgi:hypothetical protein